MIGKLQSVVPAQTIVPTADTVKAVVTDSDDSADSQATGSIQDVSGQNVQMDNSQETSVQTAPKDDDKKQKKDKLDSKAVSEMTKELNKLMDRINCNLEFQYHKEVNIMSVRMIDKSTKEVLREYPPEEMIKGMIRAKEWIGAFLDKNV